MTGDTAGEVPGLDAAARARLAALIDEVTADPARLAVRFPAVARTVARGPGDPADPDGLRVPRLEDRARVALLLAADSPSAVADLYRYGDTDEKRAVLRALDELDRRHPVPHRTDLVQDALRTNDPRLIAAALGPFATRHLEPPAWRQALLKCLFTGVPLDAVAGWADRADPTLARMVAAFAAEREAAGRPVPQDARRVLDLFPEFPEFPDADAGSES
jgi:hypothetical protein